MILSFQMVFSLFSAVVVWAILLSTSGLDPSSDIIAPRYLKLWTVSNFSLLTLMSVLMLLVINLIFSVLICILYNVEAVSRSLTRHVSSSFPASPLMLSAKRRLVSVLLPMLTDLSCSSMHQSLLFPRRRRREWGRVNSIVLLQLWFWNNHRSCC